MNRIALLVAAIGCGSHPGPAIGDGPAPDSPPAPLGPVPSCEQLPATCGATGTDSCCASPVVTGGAFLRGYDVAADGAYPDMSFPATVSSFRLDKYEVTVGRFRQFVAAGLGTQQQPPAAGAGAHPKLVDSGWNPVWTSFLAPDTATLIARLDCPGDDPTWTPEAGANELLPMTCESWYEALAFCAWDGGYLPTDAEWNYAATGGMEQRAYPWSSPPDSTAIDCAHANFGGDSWPTTACIAGALSARVGILSPVGDTAWGQADLAGNVWEWALDLWSGTLQGPCDDCANLASGVARMAKGGSAGSDGKMVRASYEGPGPFDEAGKAGRDTKLGFRCARPL